MSLISEIKKECVIDCPHAQQAIGQIKEVGDVVKCSHPECTAVFAIRDVWIDGKKESRVQKTKGVPICAYARVNIEKDLRTLERKNPSNGHVPENVTNKIIDNIKGNAKFLKDLAPGMVPERADEYID